MATVTVGRYQVSEEVTNDSSNHLQEEDGRQDPQKLQKHQEPNLEQRPGADHRPISSQLYRLQQAGGISQCPETPKERDEEHDRTNHDEEQSRIQRQRVDHICIY